MPVPRIDGATVNIGFNLGGESGFQLQSASLSPIVIPPAGEDGLVRDDVNPALILGLSAGAGLATGLVVRAAQGDSDVADPGEMLLDGLVGLQLGTGLIGDPRAESFFYGGVLSIPLQIINRADDPQWDWRVGMLTQGALSLVRDELGGNPIPYDGLRRHADGSVTPHMAELVANGATDVALDAAYYGLGNGLAAVFQGRWNRIDNSLLIGSVYGASQGVLTNLVMGAPYRPSPEAIAEGVAIVEGNGGPDVSEMVNRTTFRTGGAFGWFGGQNWAITLSRNVWMGANRLEQSTTLGHELVHRDQQAGSYSGDGSGIVRPGTGSFSFFPQYLLSSAANPYLSVPYEHEAFRFANGHDPMDTSDPVFAPDLLAAPILLGGFTLMSSLLDQDDDDDTGEPEQEALIDEPTVADD